jgi:hypothetical protein
MAAVAVAVAAMSLWASGRRGRDGVSRREFPPCDC